MITSFEARMGQGKTLSMTGLGVYHRIFELERAIEVFHGYEIGTLNFQRFSDKLTLPQYAASLEGENIESKIDALITTINLLGIKEAPNHIFERVRESLPTGIDVTPENVTTFLMSLKPVKIFANYHLSYINSEYIDFAKFAQIVQLAESGELVLHNCLFLLDEMYLWLSSRMSSSKMNRIVNNFVVQTRKRGVDLYGTTHNLTKVDKQFRGSIDIKATVRFDPARQVCRIRFRDMHTGAKAIKKLYGPAVYPFYDTKEIVKPQGKLYQISAEYASG